MFKNRTMGERRWFLRLSMLTVVLAIMITGVLMVSLQGSGIAALHASIDSYKFEFMWMRLVAIGLIALAWPRLLQYALRSGRISKEDSAELTSQRWRIIGWLLFIELLLGQNLVWRLLQALGWSGA
ncbi:MAG: hypothetical protein IH913_13260 [Proteobacteria bacterium]|nr:hypothetical protein [Pseudomonadota bacterium]